MDGSRNGTGPRLLRGLVGAGAVLGIVLASVVGLNEWADDVAVHGAPTPPSPVQVGGGETADTAI